MFVSSKKQQTGEDSDNNGRMKIVDGWEGTLKEALQKKETWPHNPQKGLHLHLTSQTQAPD